MAVSERAKQLVNDLEIQALSLPSPILFLDFMTDYLLAHPEEVAKSDQELILVFSEWYKAYLSIAIPDTPLDGDV